MDGYLSVQIGGRLRERACQVGRKECRPEIHPHRFARLPWGNVAEDEDGYVDTSAPERLRLADGRDTQPFRPVPHDGSGDPQCAMAVGISLQADQQPHIRSYYLLKELG